MLVTVATFRDPWEAAMFRFRLEAEGVGAVIAHQHHIAVIWPLSTALGGAKVQVLDEDLEAARAVARRCLSGEFRGELEAAFGDLDDPCCPKCGSHDFRQRRSIPDVIASVVMSLAVR